MLERLERQERRRRPDQVALERRARDLSRRFLDGAARPVSVRWVDNQRARWGSCTPADGTIRLSSRLQGMPGWVIDYVLLHELAHLVEPGHGRRFWALLDAYPRTERARGYLEGVAAASGLDLTGEDVDAAEDDVKDAEDDLG
jgi:predicted metal-dependent hydrolase